MIVVQRKQDISRCFYAALKSPVTLTKESLPPITKAERMIVMHSALDILRAINGSEVHRIVEVLTLWNMQPFLQKLAARAGRSKCIQALTLLSHFSDEASLAVLLKHVADTDTYTQIAALRGLAYRGAIQHMERISQSLTRSGQTNTLMLSDILKRFGEPAVPALLDLAKSNAKSEIRSAALMALGSIASLSAVDTLVRLCEDVDGDVRMESMKALGKIGDERAAPAIVDHLQEMDAQIRLHAVQALGKLKNLTSLKALVRCLHDNNWWVRFHAAESLYAFGEKGILTLRAIQTEQGIAGLIAMQVLAEHTVGV